MAVHGHEELERENRLVLRNTRGSLMSDTKWRKLFAAIRRADLKLEQYVWKFVGADQEQRHSSAILLHPPEPWIEIGCGVVPIRSIEWLLVPRFAEYDVGVYGAPVRRVEQDVESLVALIRTLGRYPMELTDRGLKIIGYLPIQ